MRKAIYRFIDWFETKFNSIIDLIALVGGTVCILLAILTFVIQLIFQYTLLQSIEIIIIPGVLGFFGIIMLFALRITRSITKK